MRSAECGMGLTDFGRSTCRNGCKWKWTGVGYPQSLNEKREAQHEWRRLARCGASTMNGGDSQSFDAMSKSYSRGVGAWCCSRTKSPESGGCRNRKLRGEWGVVPSSARSSDPLFEHAPSSTTPHSPHVFHNVHRTPLSFGILVSRRRFP